MLGAGGTCEFSAQTLRSDRRGAHVAPTSARASDPAAPPSGIAHASDDAASPMQTGKTHRLKTCATGGRSEGLPVPREPALLASAGRMPKRSQHRVSEGQDARSERPATGHWQPRAARREETQVENLCYGGRPMTQAGRSSHIGHQSGVRGKSCPASFWAICVEGSMRPAATASTGSH